MRLLSEMSSSSLPSTTYFFGFQQDMRKEKNQPRKLIRQVQGTNCLCNHYPHDVFAFFWALCDLIHFIILEYLLPSSIFAKTAKLHLSSMLLIIWSLISTFFLLFPCERQTHSLFVRGQTDRWPKESFVWHFMKSFERGGFHPLWWKFWQVTSHWTWILQDHLREPPWIKIVKIIKQIGKEHLERRERWKAKSLAVPGLEMCGRVWVARDGMKWDEMGRESHDELGWDGKRWD